MRAVRIVGSAAGAVAVLATSAALAQDSQRQLERLQRVLNNVQHEMITCAAYFGAVSACMGNVQDQKGEAAYAAAAERLVSLSTEIGMSIGLTPDAMSSRAKMEAERIKGLLNNSCVNVSSIMSRHMDRCKVVASNPDAILAEYEAKFALEK